MTKPQPMMDAMMDTPPSSSGYTTALPPMACMVSAPRVMVAISVTA